MKKWKKVLIIVVAVVLIAIITIVASVIIHNKEASKRAGELAKYENWRSATIDKIADYCKIDLDKVNKIRVSISDAEKKNVGYIVDGENDVRVDYILSEEKIVKELINKLADVEVYGVKEEIWEKYDKEREWSLKFYVDDMDYSLVIGGNSMEQEGVEALTINVFHSGAGASRFDEFPDPNKYMGSEICLIYDQELIEYVYNLREKYVRNIKVEDILKIYEMDEPEMFFAYENSGMRMREDFDITSDEVFTHLYTFPIDDFEGYIVLEKENDGRDGKEGGTGKAKDYISYTDIVSVEIFNNNGESIDFFNATKQELEDFLK